MKHIPHELTLAIRLARQEFRARPPLYQGTIMGDHVG
jgi:hypothetical protein